ncbi:MAG: hypothetical protein AAGD14_00385 [Planctomycetota bacterium]
MIVLLLALLPMAETREEAVEAVAQEGAPRDWDVGLTIYGWLIGFDVEVDGERIQADFGDVLEYVNAGGMFRLTGRWKRWTGYVDYLFADLGDSGAIGPGSGRIDIDQHNIDFRIGYIVYRDEGAPGVDVIVEAGGRWWYTKTAVTIEFPPLLPGRPGIREEFRDTSQWFDLLVGVRVRWRLAEWLVFSAHANVGGFGLGESSDYAWDVGFVFNIRLARYLSLPIGYRALQYERNEIKNTLQGPIIGISIVF